MDRKQELESELLEIKGGRELVTAEEILTYAEEHRDSAWAQELEWNDKVAGREHRLNQVRQLIITLEITIGKRVRRFHSLSIDRHNRMGGGYRDINDILREQTLYDVMLQDALNELARMKERYELLKELKPLWDAAEKLRRGRGGKGGKPKGGKGKPKGGGKGKGGDQPRA